jgi:hypothetical protein
MLEKDINTKFNKLTDTIAQQLDMYGNVVDNINFSVDSPSDQEILKR